MYIRYIGGFARDELVLCHSPAPQQARTGGIFFVQQDNEYGISAWNRLSWRIELLYKSLIAAATFWRC